MIAGRTAGTACQWDQVVPREAPFVPSTSWTGLRATGRFASYGAADTWYPSWGSDDRLYSPFTDGTIHGIKSWSIGPEAVTGHAAILGDDPLDLVIEDIGVVAGSPEPYGGRYPSASLMLDGVWYYGTYCLAETGRSLNWDILGPFVGFRTSTDLGTTWDEGPCDPAQPLFGEAPSLTDPIRMGAPHFVDFGKNMERSPDGYAYLVGHGSRISSARSTWVSSDEVFLARVKPTPATVNDGAAWQFYAGVDMSGGPTWTSDRRKASPILSWPGHLGCVTITAMPGGGKYLMCVTDGWPTIKEMDSYVMEADALTGPWRLVAGMPEFGKQGYFLNFPSKFISPDGTTAWLWYSANFTNNYLPTKIVDDPAGSRYGLCLLELELIKGTG